MLKSEVECESFPDGETDVECGREVVFEERHIAGIRNEVVWGIV